MSDLASCAETRKSKSSSFVASIFAFALLNVSLQFVLGQPGFNHFADLFMLQNQTVMPEIINYSKPGIAFLGSSVIEVPLCLLDKRTGYSSEIKNAEQIISAEMGKTVPSRLLAIEGALMSDQYLVLRQLIQAKEPPLLVVLAIVPRDFYDNRFKKCSQTAGFRALGSMSEWPEYLGSLDEYTEAFFYKTVWLYKMKGFLSSEFVLSTIGFLKSSLGLFNYGSTQIVTDPVPTDFARKPDSKLMQASLNEYRGVYLNIEKAPQYSKQMKFLLKALTLARTQKQALLLINLPLTEANRDLLPAGFFERYRHDVYDAAAKTNTEFLDLNRRGLFETSDFWDSGHLGVTGAKKLLNFISPEISKILKAARQQSAAVPVEGD